MMFSSIQSPKKSVAPQCPKHLTGLTNIDLETLLAQGDRLNNAKVVDAETRQQILQSLVLRMRHVRYLRHLPVSKQSQQTWF